MEEIIAFGILVAMPVMIVWLINRTRQNETNRRTEIMLKAIEAGTTVNLDLFETQKKKNPKTIKERLLGYLMGGCMTILLGVVGLVVSYIIVQEEHGFGPVSLMSVVASGVFFSTGISLIIAYAVGMKTLAKEIEAETKSLEQK